MDGTGTGWDYYHGYAYRLPAYVAGNGGTFAIGEWLIDYDSLAGPGDPVVLLQTLTTPGTHDVSAYCGPNPAECLILSEIVHAAASGDCPRWIEITNTGLVDYTFFQGGIIVQLGSDSDVTVDVDLTGQTIVAGDSFVINSNALGCTGAFPNIYGFPADVNTYAEFGDGDARFILTDTADGSNLLDIYGEFGVDGTGTAWDYYHGYAYRLPEYNAGNDGVFAIGEWLIDYDSLAGPGDPVVLLQTLTTPGAHDYDEDCVPGGDNCLNLADANCDGSVNAFDIDPFVVALADRDTWEATYDCDYLCANDVNCDGSVNAFDIDPFVACLASGGCGQCP